MFAEHDNKMIVLEKKIKDLISAGKEPAFLQNARANLDGFT